MPFTTPALPDVDPSEFNRRPTFERIRVLSRFWSENGFGSPTMLHVIYIAKLVVLSTIGGLLIITATSDVGSIVDVGRWWDEPIVWQKLVLWVTFLEVFGIGGAWGPLTGHFKPFYGGARYFARPGLIRMAPWPGKVPFTAGDTRTVFDAALYVAFLISLIVAIVMPGVHERGIPAEYTGGLVRSELMIAPIVLLIVLGLRDKVVFLCARGEQYLPALVIFAVLDFEDLIIAGKLLIVIVWCCAAISKFGVHFTHVVPPMVSNAPFTPKALRRLHYRNAPDDLLPSRFASFMAHVLGTTAELVVPLVLLFSTNRTLTLIGVACMVAFHLFITSTFPLAVPLEWNILFGYIAIILFAGFQAGDGHFGVFDLSEPWLLPVLVVAFAFFPVLGNLRPDLVSFLPSMRQYAGNWASSVWSFAPGAEQRLNDLNLPARTHIEQLEALDYDPEVAELMLDLFVAWRSMHSQGRGLLSVLSSHLGDDFDRYTVREGEIGANLILGWNFGDGHIHDLRFLEAVQRRLGYAPGEFVVAWVESQPIHRRRQEYFVWDAALGVVQRGTWRTDDLVSEQPWLPNGPIPFQITWQPEARV